MNLTSAVYLFANILVCRSTCLLVFWELCLCFCCAMNFSDDEIDCVDICADRAC